MMNRFQAEAGRQKQASAYFLNGSEIVIHASMTESDALEGFQCLFLRELGDVNAQTWPGALEGFHLEDSVTDC
jgi:hypothetical protein